MRSRSRTSIYKWRSVWISKIFNFLLYFW